MPKKGEGGFWDSLFDFDGDGKTDIGEEWLAFKIFEECMREDEPEDVGLEDRWQLYCEDGSEYGISPYCYETECEYAEALAEAKRAYAGKHKCDWRKACDDNMSGLDPEDHETQEECGSEAEEWADDLPDEIQAKMEQYFLSPAEFSSEAELLEYLSRLEEAEENDVEAPPPEEPEHTVLARSLEAADKAKVLAALREGLRTNARLTILAHISMDPADGAGAKCVYIIECAEHNGRWALAYTSPDIARAESTGACITAYQGKLLRSFVGISDIDGVMFRSRSCFFCLAKQDIIDMLAEDEHRAEAWDAICTRRTILRRETV